MKIIITFDPERYPLRNLYFVMMDMSTASVRRSFLWNSLQEDTAHYTLDTALTEYLDDYSSEEKDDHTDNHF